MSEQLHEQISAFVDGELSRAETELLLRRLERDAELRATLVRYSSMGYGIRDRASRGASPGFAARVASAIAVQAPEHKPQGRVAIATSRWLRPVAGFAVAATVAVVAIVGVRQLQDPVESATQVAATSEPGSALSPVVIGNLPVDEAASYTVPGPTTDMPILPAARLTNYVVAHSQYSSALQRRNVLTGIIAEDPTPLDAAGQPVQNEAQATEDSEPAAAVPKP